MSDDVSGTDWPDFAVELAVADYFEMLRLELDGHRPNKAEHNRKLQGQTGRKRTSIEFKHQNISAVMERLGLPRIKGYKRRSHFQDALNDAVDRKLAGDGKWLLKYVEEVPQEPQPATFEIYSPPAPQPEKGPGIRSLHRLVRKYDAAARDAHNRSLGRLGEELVLKHERSRLVAIGRDDLADKVEWTSDERGDGAGYDIHSFTDEGADRLIEVKTTNGPALTPFYLSENERSFSETKPEAFRLLRLHDFRAKPAAFELAPPLSDWVKLSPSIYRASF